MSLKSSSPAKKAEKSTRAQISRRNQAMGEAAYRAVSPASLEGLMPSPPWSRAS